jgi:uncharacterized protein YecE (DUF72 family)
MKVHVGTSGYSYREWKGAFYPEKISPKDMLHAYSEHLNTVEINNTFYHMPTEKMLNSWAEQVGNDFVFALKAPQVITHWKRLRNVGSEVAFLFKALPTLDGKLGPLLFQFPKTFPANAEALEAFLSLVPDSALCAFEFRNPSWLEEDVLKLLRSKGCGLCVADADEDPAKEIVSTAPLGYLRLRRSDYTDADLAAWAEKVLAQKWEQAFVFFKHEGDEARGPKLAIRFQGIVDARGKEIETAGLRKAG